MQEPTRPTSGPAPTGGLWPMDRLGRVQNAGHVRFLSRHVRAGAGWVVEAAQRHLGADVHSVYVLGAAARGRPGPMEMLILQRMSSAQEPSTPDGHADPLWLAEAAHRLDAGGQSPEPSHVRMRRWRDVFPKGRLYSTDRFRIGVTSACVYGRDASRHIAPQRLRLATANGWIVNAQAEIARFAGRLALAAQPEDVRREARTVGRLLMSVAFALVMTAEDVYTEDPNLQRDLFRLWHPQRAADAARACAYIQRPPDAAYELLHLLDGFGRWLAAECDRWLDAHNPQRRAVMPI